MSVNEIEFTFCPLSNVFQNTDYNDKVVSVYQNPDREKYNTRSFTKFKQICKKHLRYIRCIDIPDINKESKYATCMVYPNREVFYLEFIIRNMVLKLKDQVSYYIVCFNDNKKHVEKVAKKISNNINIITINGMNVKNKSQYNNLLMQFQFWSIFKCEKMLMYTDDSFLFNRDDIMKYYEYDYIGAPWINKPNGHIIGNGGFSIRNIELMKNITKRKIRLNTPNGKQIEEEDLYFAMLIKHLKLECKYPEIIDSINFSVFNVNLIDNEKLCGGFQFWFSLPDWETIVENNILDLN